MIYPGLMLSGLNNTYDCGRSDEINPYDYPVSQIVINSVNMVTPVYTILIQVTGHLSDSDICPTQTFVRQPVRNFADICPTRTFVRQSHFKFILKTISQIKGAISGDYR